MLAHRLFVARGGLAGQSRVGARLDGSLIGCPSLGSILVWLSHLVCGPVRARWRGVAGEGSAQLETALPVLADTASRVEVRRTVMDRVVIGMDPHKRSVTIEARDTREVLRTTGRLWFPPNRGGFLMPLPGRGRWSRS